MLLVNIPKKQNTKSEAENVLRNDLLVCDSCWGLVGFIKDVSERGSKMREYEEVRNRVRSRFPTWNISPDDIQKIVEIVNSFQDDEQPENLGLSLLHLEGDPITGHHPDCQCFRCFYGDDKFVWLFSPGEF